MIEHGRLRAMRLVSIANHCQSRARPCPTVSPWHYGVRSPYRSLPPSERQNGSDSSSPASSRARKSHPVPTGQNLAAAECLSCSDGQVQYGPQQATGARSQDGDKIAAFVKGGKFARVGGSI